MNPKESRQQDPGRGLVSAAEKARIANAVAVARNRAPDRAEVDALVEWVARTRIEYMMTERVLDGSLSAFVEGGQRYFLGQARARLS
jgi:hypothetical protein